MIARSIKGKVLVFSVFLLGIVSGVLATNVWETRVSSAAVAGDLKSTDSAKAKHDVNKFYDYLGLSAEQRDQAAQIVKDSKPDLDKILAQTRPQMDAYQKQTRNQIRAILNNDQKKKYDEFNDKIDAKRNKQRSQH